MLFLSFVATYRASDICQGANVITCVTLVNLDHPHNNNAYFEVGVVRICLLGMTLVKISLLI